MHCIEHNYAIPKFQMYLKMTPKGIGDSGFGKQHFLGYMLNLGSAVTFAPPE